MRRLGLDYVDIFYSHRFDPETPLEETMGALDQLVRSGKALYVGISNYPAEETRRAARILRELGTPCLIHQPSYSLFNRWIEPELLAALSDEKMGCIAFSPLAQGLLTDKYLNGIPEDSRAGKEHGFLRPEQVTAEKLDKIRSLSAIADARGQKLAQMAIAWVLRHPGMTSALIGASKVSQIEDAVAALDNAEFSAAELARHRRHRADLSALSRRRWLADRSRARTDRDTRAVPPRARRRARRACRVAGRARIADTALRAAAVRGPVAQRFCQASSVCVF